MTKKSRWKYISDPLPDWVEGSLEERFTRIYRRRFWEAAESVSGPGSSVGQAEQLISQLPLLFSMLGVQSLLDIPCGDFNWMRKVDLSGIDYTGSDIVRELIESNQSKYGAPKRRFLHLDMTRDELPTVDVIFCRDGLVHLSYADIELALERFRASRSRYLLSTTFPDRDEAPDIKTGDWRPLNLQRQPLGFPEPELLINEGCPEKGYEAKSLGLWRL
jgi:hypothetical protein